MLTTAVILTARKERDSDIPYPLIPFEWGICLLDRTLSILRGLGYKKILLVVGYRRELFDKYQAPDVAIIFNKDFPFTASMGSLATVRDSVCSDFLLVEGDTFYESKVVEKITATQSGNCLAITEESGSGDEAFVETSHGFIIKVTKDRHQISNIMGELLGICRISLRTFRRMLEIWDGSNNPYLNYEYALMDSTCILERQFIMFPNLIWGDTDNKSNFDKLCTQISLKLRKKEDPFDHENIISHMETIFPNTDVRENLKIEQIGGMSNKNFKVTLSDKSYVLRIPGNGSDGMVIREFEEQNSIMASKMGINPSIRYFNPKTGVKLVDYIDDAETLNNATIQRNDIMPQIAQIYRTLHDSNVRFNNDFNVFHEIRNYENLMIQAGASMYDGYGDIRTDIFRLEDRLNEIGVQLKPCHNDSVAENFIKASDGTVFLIDWEYSGMNDPIWDLAALFLESNFTDDNKAYFLSKYYQGDMPAKTEEKILIYQILMDVLWSIWTVIKEFKGDDFGSYGKDRFKRAISNLQKLTIRREHK